MRTIAVRGWFVLSFLSIYSGSCSLFAQTPSSSLSGRRIVGPGEAPQPFPEAKAISQPRNDEELVAAITKLADELVKSGRFSGSIFLAADGRPLLNNAWGDADKQANVAATPATAYDLGSIGKLFTQIGILQLVDEGKLTLDEPLARYLRDYPDPEVAQKVTVRQLLLHKSGIPDVFNNITAQTPLGAMTEVKDFLPLFAHKPLEFAPGSAQRYSSSGYIVLGLIIEAVSGENYYTYVQRHILEPTRMTHSGFFDRTELPSFVAHSYEDGKDVTGVHPRRGCPAGGLQASAEDLFRLLEAVNRGNLIKRDTIALLRDLVPRPPDAAAPADNGKLFGYGISGGAPGVSATLAVDPSGRYTRVVLSNSGPPMAMSMAATIRHWIDHMPKLDRS